MPDQTTGEERARLTKPPKPRRMSRADRLEARNSLLLGIMRRVLDQLGADCVDAAVETLTNASKLNLTHALTGGDPKVARQTQAIVLIRVEGDGCRVVVTRDTHGDDLWFAADSILKGMALALSPTKQELYDKFDLYVVWGDGQIYEDTFDLYHITSPHFETLTEHIAGLVESYEILQQHEAGSPIVNGVYVERLDQTAIGGKVFYFTSSVHTHTCGIKGEGSATGGDSSSSGLTTTPSRSSGKCRTRSSPNCRRRTPSSPCGRPSADRHPPCVSRRRRRGS